MKQFRVSLQDGENLTFTGNRLSRDGQGVHIFDDLDNVIATFANEQVLSAYELSTDAA